MGPEWKSIVIMALCAAAYANSGLAQVGPPIVLEIQVDAVVSYWNDVLDPSKLATEQLLTSPPRGRTFDTFFSIGDIVAVNGRAVKGTWVLRGQVVQLTTNPSPGQAVADTIRQTYADQTWEILQTDGTPVGSIMASGLTFGAPPPGAPRAFQQGNSTIVGGTGAFLGMRGQVVAVPAASVAPERVASMSEDPAGRRSHGGGTQRYGLHLIPMSWPEIVWTGDGPAVHHSSDFTPVTESNPARAGEILTLFATGLGPTRPGVEPGKPFTAATIAFNKPDQIYMVNSPVEVTVDGVKAYVLYAAGYPNTTDMYQVNFQLPSPLKSGLVNLGISAAWIAGPEVKISIESPPPEALR